LAERRVNGLVVVSAATAIAGLGAYAITTVIARGLGTGYAVFAIFWSVLYLVAGALSGIQQEVTRATEPRPAMLAGPRRANVVVFAGGASAIAGVLVLVTGPLWAPLVFAKDSFALLVPLSVGAALYVLISAATGTMYGVHSWLRLAAFTIVDVAFRLALVLVGLALGVGVVGLAWAAVVPFLLAILVVALPARTQLFTTTQLDVTYGAATRNVLRTVIAAGSAAVLVSGFPLLVGVTSGAEVLVPVSAVLFALTLTRAPIVVVTLSLQSYLLVQLKERPRQATRILLLVVGAIAVLGVVLALVAGAIGAPVLVWLAGEPFRLPAEYVALLVATSVFTGWLIATGTAVLARKGHTIYSVGWLVAAVVSAALMFMPLGLYERSLLALALGPLAGIVVHIGGLVRGRLPGELLEPKVE
jgi:O-antigen/teichoic acid export membrane protein